MSWPMVAIKDVARVVTGKTPSTVDGDNFGGEIPFITPSELGLKVYVTTSPRTLSEKGAAEIKLVPKDAVMVCCIGSLGKLAIAGATVATNQQINSVIFDVTKVDAKYGFYALQLLKPKMESMATSTTVAIINKSNFELLQIPLPPLPEQKRIATILEKADAIRCKRQQAIQLADNFLSALFLDMFGDPVTNPKGWEIKPVGNLCNCIVPGRDKPKTFSGATPWITTNEINHLGITHKKEEGTGLSADEISEVRAKVVPRGSVIMTCVGDLGVVTIAGENMVINQQLHAFLPSENLTPAFLSYSLAMQKGFMLRMASSTTLSYMNKSICNSVPIMLPPKRLQEQFEILVSKVSASKSKMLSFANERFFQCLSHQAFSGLL